MRIPLVLEELTGLHPGHPRPVSVGVPLAKGAARDVRELRLVDAAGAALPVQLAPLARWSDSSLRWVLVDALLDVEPRGRVELALARDGGDGGGRRPGAATPLVVDASPGAVEIDTGAVVATIPRAGDRLVASLRVGREGREVPVLDEAAGLGLTVTGADLETRRVELTSVDVSAAGPVRATVTARGRLGPRLVVIARISLWAGRGLVRLDLTVRNPDAATHRGGTWDLGDPGSVLFEDLSLLAPLAARAARIDWTDSAAGPLERGEDERLEIFQDSSGGERWDFATHLNRELRVPHRFRGYRVSAAGPEPLRRGDRATPTVWVSTPSAGLGATVQGFWQNFPKALEAGPRGLTIRLWPHQHADLHELQGGEQKTHTVWLSVEAPAASLGWVQRPALARSTPSHYAASGVFPHLIEWDADRNAPLLELARAAIDPARGLAARRELIDEYGWRHFGDVVADHESVGAADGRPRVSHYNNQYDGLYGALAQFARSGDAAWFELADDLARHVADVDVYHTQLDRSAFNGGLFWHTDHYTDASTSTHRCYSRHSPQAQRGPYGGGPAAEHDYATGLATHFLMTGWAPSREAALSLAAWVIDMDGPESGLAGRLLPGPSGLATRTGDHSYHGPGRGAGNSIETLLDGLELSGDERYLHTAEALIRRCVHPNDDREAFGLASDPEHRWSYVVVLQALVRYLEVKAERGELDERYAYAQAVLVSYARWMLEHERLSSAQRERLEIWTESWPAQDLRKGLVLMHASRHVRDGEERRRLFARGRELFDAAQAELLEWETRTLARPLVLVLRYGYPASWLAAHPLSPMPIVEKGEPGRPSGFVPWKGKPKALVRRIKRTLGR